MCLYPALVQIDEIAPTAACILGLLNGLLRISNVTEVILKALSLWCAMLLKDRYCRNAGYCDAGAAFSSRSQARADYGWAVTRCSDPCKAAGRICRTRK